MINTQTCCMHASKALSEEQACLARPRHDLRSAIELERFLRALLRRSDEDWSVIVGNAALVLLTSLLQGCFKT